MFVAASVEPKPLAAPLPGGQTGATVRLHPLLAGEMRAPPGLLEAPSGPLKQPRGLGLGRSRSDWIWLPIPAFLIEHPAAGPMLVDTGFHPSVALDPKRNFGRLGAAINTFRMTPEQGLHHQLRARGIDPMDVGVVLMTHLHSDHASGVSEFPNATFVVDEREWEAATRPRGVLRGYHVPQFDYGFDWRSIDYEARDIDSFATFGGGSVDVFGDGSVRLVSTPGHTAGHQSVLLRLSGREALLTGDASYLERGLREDVRPLLMDDEHHYWRSLKEIRRYLEQAPGALVITGHDTEAWPRLEPVYE